MKYRVYEEKDCNGITYSYGLEAKFLFWWIGGVRSYWERETAQKMCDRMNGYRTRGKP